MRPKVIDTTELRLKASSDDLKEAYETVFKGEDYRIGAGVRVSQPEETKFFLEVIVPLCREDRELNIPELRSKLDLLEKFENFGYTLRCEKDNSIICEKMVREDDLESEYEELESFLEGIN